MKKRMSKLHLGIMAGGIFGYVVGGIKVGVLVMLGIYAFWFLLEALMDYGNDFIENVGEDKDGTPKGS